jgi:hypothetical protein
MGECNSILLRSKAGDLVLYSHWDSVQTLKAKLKQALTFKSRWDDIAYLRRIIFSHMIKNEVLSETGYGIYLGNEGADGEIVFHVDMDNKTVDGKSYAEFIK